MLSLLFATFEWIKYEVTKNYWKNSVVGIISTQTESNYLLWILNITKGVKTMIC